MSCPWCDEDEAVPFADLTESQPALTCQSCGTIVELLEEGSAWLREIAA